MPFKWSDVEQSSKYVNADALTKRKIQKGYFDEVIKASPDFPTDRAEEVEQRWFSRFDTKELPLASGDLQVEPREPSIRVRGDLIDKDIPVPISLGPQFPSVTIPIKDPEALSVGPQLLVSSALDAATLSLSKGLGIDPEKIKQSYTELGGQEADFIQSAGNVVGFATLLPRLWTLGGGKVAARALTPLGTHVAEYVGAKLSIPALTRKLVAQGVGSAILGGEHGFLRSSIEETFDAIKTQSPSVERRLSRIGIKTAEDAALFAGMEALMGVGIVQGTSFFRSPAGQAFSNSLRRLGTKGQGAFREAWASLIETSNPIMRSLRRRAKQRGVNIDEELSQFRKIAEANMREEVGKRKGMESLIGTLKGVIEKRKMPGKILESKIKSDIESTGAQFRGVQPGFRKKDGTSTEGLVMFNDPETNTTLALKPSLINKENVRAKLEESRSKFNEGIIEAKRVKSAEEALLTSEDVERDRIISLRDEAKRRFLAAKAEGKLPQTILDDMENRIYRYESRIHRKQSAKTVLENPEAVSDVAIKKAAQEISISDTTPATVTPKKSTKVKSNRAGKPVEVEPAQSYEQYMNVSYLSDRGPIITSMKAVDVKAIKDSLSKGVIPTDRGMRILKWLEDTPILPNDEGFVSADFYSPEAWSKAFKELFPDIKLGKGDSHLFKNLSIPFWVGQKYPEFRPVFDSMQRAMFKSNEQTVTFLEMLNEPLLRGLPEISKRKLGHVLWEGDSRRGRGYLNHPSRAGKSGTIPQYYTNEELRKLYNLNREEIRAYRSMTGAMQYATNIVRDNLRIKKGILDKGITSERVAEIESEINYELSTLHGYLPHFRDGEFAVFIKRAREGGLDPRAATAPQVTYYQQVKKGMIPGRESAPALKHADMVAKELGVPRDRVTVKRVRELNRDDYKQMSIDTLEFLNENARVGATEEQVRALDFALEAYKKSLLKSKSPRAIHRNDVPGFERTFESAMNAINRYGASATFQTAKTEGMHDAQVSLDTLAKQMDPSLRSYAQQYINNVYREGKHSFKKVQLGMYTYQLALDLGYGLVNMTQFPIFGQRELVKYFPAHQLPLVIRDSYGMALKYLHYRKFPKVWKGKSLPEEFHMLNDLSRKGALGPAHVSFLLGDHEAKRSLTGTGVHYLGRAVSAINRWTEAANRTATSVSAFQAAKAQGLSKDRWVDFAIELNNRINFAYGRYNSPVGMTASGDVEPFIRMWYSFKSFSHNAIHTFIDGLKDKRLRVKLATLMAMSAGGLQGLPMYGLVRKAFDAGPETAAGLARFYNGIRDSEFINNIGDKLGIKRKREVGDWIDQATLMDGVDLDYILRSNLKGPVGTFLRKGWGTIAGADLSYRIGYGEIIDPELDLTSQIGYVGSLYRRIQDLVEYASQGNIDMLREESGFGLHALRNIMKAHREAKDAIRNKQGEWIGGATNPYETVLNSIGIRPLRVSEIYEDNRYEKFVENKLRRRNKDINSRLSNLIDKERWTEYDSLMKNIINYNRTVEPHRMIKPGSPDIIRRVYAKRYGKSIKDWPTQARLHLYQSRETPLAKTEN